MSGHKIASVTISQDEYRRLYALEKNIQYQSDSFNQAQQVIDLDDLKRNIYSDLGNRYDSYLGMVSSVKSDLAELEFNTSQRLLEQQAIILEAFEQRTKSFSTKYAQDQSEIHRFISTLSNSIERLQESQMKVAAENESLILERIARDASIEENIRTSQMMISELVQIIEGEYPGHLIDSDEVGSIKVMLNFSLDNSQQGYLETGLSTAQNGLIQARKLHQRIQMEYFRYITFYSEMIVQFNELSEKFDQYQSFEPIDADGVYLGQKMPLNLWSKGIYAELVSELNTLGEVIRANQYNLPFHNIEMILDQKLPDLYARFSDCLTTARLEVISSQRRFEIANKIILGLIEQGYKPVFGEYEQHSFVNGYVASVENGYSKINIFIDPIQNTHSENEIHLVSLDFNQVSKHELDVRAASVSKSFADPSLESTPFKEVDNSVKAVLAQPIPLQSKFSKRKK